MDTIYRHKAIIEKINNEEQVKVQNLCDELDVSSVTIRKDLRLLEEKGFLYRIHGGATLNNPYAIDKHVNEKEKIHFSEKMKIGSEAAKMITQDDSILIASGTTVLCFAKCIVPNDSLTVITSALNVALELNNHLEIDVIQLAGNLRKRSSSVTGMYAEKILSDFSCTKFFLGVDGIDLDFGFTTTNMMEAKLNREMMKISQKTIVLADASKFGKRGFGKICAIDQIDEVITDDRISDYTKNSLEDLGVTVTIV